MLPRPLCRVQPRIQVTATLEQLTSASHSPVHPFIANCLLSTYCVPVTAANRIYLLPLGAHALCLAWFQEESACNTQEARGSQGMCQR